MLAQAATTADAITGEEHQAWRELLDLPVDAGEQTSADERPSALSRSLDLYPTALGAEICVVDREGEVVATIEEFFLTCRLHHHEGV